MRISKRYRRILSIALMAAMISMLTGCTTYDNFKRTFLDKNSASETVVYIGVYEPLSGTMEKVGKDEVKGIELAHSIYSNVKGVRVELVQVDTQSDTKAAKTAIDNLIEMNPVAIIGSAGEANSMIASSAVKEAKIPTITPSASNPLITQDNKYYFRASITQNQRGSGLAEYAYNELDSRDIAIVTVENDSSMDPLRDGFKSKLRKLAKGKPPIVMEKEIPVEQTSMKKLVRQIKDSDADVVFMPVGIEKADLIFAQVEKQGLTDVTFLGNQNWNSDDLVAIAEKHPNIKLAFASDAVITANQSTKDTVTAETQRFLIEYSKMYGSDDIPSQNAVLGYDAYLLVIHAINNAKSLEPKDIRDALADTKDLRCATGVFNFDEDGNPVRTVNISTVKDGKVVSAYVTESSSSAASMKKIEK